MMKNLLSALLLVGEITPSGQGTFYKGVGA